MRSIAIIAFLALLIAPCIAETDNVTTGPYKITFDLGIPKEAYKVEIADPKIEESLSGEISTTYEMHLINKTEIKRQAIIILTSHEDEQVIPTQDELVQLGEQEFSNDKYHDAEVAGRKIDGYDGVAGSATLRVDSTIDDPKVYFAMYNPSSTLAVGLFFSIPWEEGTLSLLKTIHVEKINETT